MEREPIQSSTPPTLRHSRHSELWRRGGGQALYHISLFAFGPPVLLILSHFNYYKRNETKQPKWNENGIFNDIYDHDT